MKNIFQRIPKAIPLLIAMLAVVLPLTAQGASGTARSVGLTAGAASTVDMDKPVADILVANPAIVDVGTLRANRLYLVGKAVGDTNVLAFDDQGNQLADIAVHVRVDESNIRETLKKFFPNEKIEAKAIKNDIVLTGTVSTPSVANQVRDLSSRFLSAQGQTVVDLMKVAGEQQVMLQVKVIEAQRSVLREYGLETDYNVNAAATTVPSSIARGGFNSSGGQTGLSALTPFASGALFINRDGNPFKVALAGLEQNGLVNTLASPNLTAISGETAGFLAGGEFPVPTGRDTNGNITIEFKQFGVALNFTPTVLASDRISLQLSTEVSAKSSNPADGLKLSDTQIPGLTTRRAETTVQLGSGGTIMIAGLLKSEDVHNLNGFPGIQDIPILGELFKSKSFSRNESELIIIVTPYLVQPYAQAQADNVASAAPVSKKSAEFLGKQEKALPASHAGLSDTLINNLTKVYGSKMPLQSVNTAVFGYIVD